MSEQVRIKDQEDAVKAELVADGHTARRENKETLLVKKQTNNISLKKETITNKMSRLWMAGENYQSFTQQGNG